MACLLTYKVYNRTVNKNKHPYIFPLICLPVHHLYNLVFIRNSSLRCQLTVTRHNIRIQVNKLLLPVINPDSFAVQKQHHAQQIQSHNKFHKQCFCFPPLRSSL